MNVNSEFVCFVDQRHTILLTQENLPPGLSKRLTKSWTSFTDTLRTIMGDERLLCMIEMDTKDAVNGMYWSMHAYRRRASM